jgi:hypothetical protein
MDAAIAMFARARMRRGILKEMASENGVLKKIAS